MNNKQVLPLVKKMMEDEVNILSIQESRDFEDGREFYFTYPKDRYLWSVARSDGGTNYLFFYPSSNNKGNFLRFKGTELPPEVSNEIKKLFDLIEQKSFGFDKVVDDILGAKSK